MRGARRGPSSGQPTKAAMPRWGGLADLDLQSQARSLLYCALRFGLFDFNSSIGFYFFLLYRSGKLGLQLTQGHLVLSKLSRRQKAEEN